MVLMSSMSISFLTLYDLNYVLKSKIIHFIKSIKLRDKNISGQGATTNEQYPIR